jgi:hypothetical protein
MARCSVAASQKRWGSASEVLRLYLRGGVVQVWVRRLQRSLAVHTGGLPGRGSSPPPFAHVGRQPRCDGARRRREEEEDEEEQRRHQLRPPHQKRHHRWNFGPFIWPAELACSAASAAVAHFVERRGRGTTGAAVQRKGTASSARAAGRAECRRRVLGREVRGGRAALRFPRCDPGIIMRTSTLWPPV